MLRLVESPETEIDPSEELEAAIFAMKRAECNPLLTCAESRALVAHREMLELVLVSPRGIRV